MINKVLNLSLFFYVSGVFIVSKIEGLSMATNLALLVFLLILAAKGLKKGLAGLSYCLLVAPLALVLFVSVFWSKYQLDATISFLSFVTACTGGMALFLALLNGASTKPLFWGAFLGSGFLAYSAWHERTVLMLSRVAGLAGNPNTLALSLVVAGIILSSNRLSESRMPKLYSFFLLLFSVFVTGSRKTLAVLILIPAVWGAGLLTRRINKGALKKIALTLAGFLVFSIIGGTYFWSQFSETSTYRRTVLTIEGKDMSSDERFSMIVDGLDLWASKPVLGYGINQYRFVSGYGTYSHNNYIELLVSGGLPALTAYYGMIFLMLFKARKLKGQDRSIVFFSLILLLVWDFALVSYAEKYIWVLLGFCSWLVLSGDTSHKTQYKGKSNESFVEPGFVRKVILPETEGNT